MCQPSVLAHGLLSPPESFLSSIPIQRGSMHDFSDPPIPAEWVEPYPGEAMDWCAQP